MPADWRFAVHPTNRLDASRTGRAPALLHPGSGSSASVALDLVARAWYPPIQGITPAWAQTFSVSGSCVNRLTDAGSQRRRTSVFHAQIGAPSTCCTTQDGLLRSSPAKRELRPPRRSASDTASRAASAGHVGVPVTIAVEIPGHRFSLVATTRRPAVCHAVVGDGSCCQATRWRSTAIRAGHSRGFMPALLWTPRRDSWCWAALTLAWNGLPAPWLRDAVGALPLLAARRIPPTSPARPRSVPRRRPPRDDWLTSTSHACVPLSDLWRHFQTAIQGGEQAPTAPTPVDAVSPSLLYVDRGGDPRHLADHPGGVAMPGEVFCHIHVAGPKAVDGTVAQADFCLAGQGDDVLPPWGGVPITQRARRCRTEHDALGTVERGQLGVGRQIEFFHVRLAIVTGIQAENAHTGPS